MDSFYRERIEEFEKGWDDFFEDRPAPESEEESLDMQEEFIQWYNTERKQSRTGMTPEDMDMKFAFEREEPYMERLREANACIGREEFTTAGEIADEVLERDPENKMALQISTQSKIMECDLDRAEKVLDRWESLDIEDPYTFLHRALLGIMKMDLQSALEEVDKALEIEPELFDAVVLKAQLLDFLDDERAEDADIGRKALPEDFDEEDELPWGFVQNRPFLRALKNLGLLHLENGDVDKALSIFEENLSYNPNDNQGIRGLLTEVYLEKGLLDEVVELRKKFPDDAMPATRYGHALALFKKGEKEKATDELKDAVEDLPKVAKELLKEEHEEPDRMMPGTVSFGGWDQAYDHWEAFGEYWGEDELRWLEDVLDEVESFG